MAMFGNSSGSKNMFGFDPSRINMGLLLGGLGGMAGQNPQQQMQMMLQGGMTGYGMDQDRRERSEKEKTKQQQQQALEGYLSAGNFSPGESALMSAYPDLAVSVAGDRMKPQENNFGFSEVGGTLLSTDPRTGKASPVYSSQNAGQADPATLANITTLRKDYGDEPGVSRYRSSLPILTSMNAAISDTTAMADLDFIYGMAQIFDPDSVVRETEMGMVIDSQSMPAALKGRLEKVLNGQATLGPQARRDLVSAAGRRVGEYKNQAVEEGAQFEGIASRHNIPREDIMRPLGKMPEMQMQGPMNAPPVGTIEDGHRFKGGDPTDPNNWEPVL